MHIFPASGFDQSATTPVFLGVLVSWLMTETFGWVFAGLVVPGYLATLFLLDPRSAAIDVGEAVLTYGIARLLGEHLSRTGLTSRVFGRERFLLVLIVSILVRLGLEGVAFAALVPHATWAYSIGLVVVPLAANACWKTGLLRGAVQTGVPTAIVYALLRYVLVPHTNLSLAGFHLATENIAASFLASPRAYLLLLTGAVLAASANLRYGWDYNGILLPALLALVVANPGELAATLAEIFILLWVMRAVLGLTPIGRWNIEGPRRPMLFFGVDYALRFGFAALLGGSLPGTGFAEVSGFGYLLPTLLAVKISQKGLASLVLLPTAIVSVAAFGLGNALGFAAERLDSDSGSAPDAGARETAQAPAAPVHAALWLSALARPGAARAPERNPRGAAWLGQLADALLADPHARVPADVAVQHLSGGVLLLRERFDDANHRLGMPALLLAPAPARDRIVVLVEEPLAAPETAAIAAHLLTAGVADAVVIAGVEGDPQRGSASMPSARTTAKVLADGNGLLFRRHGFVALLRRGAPEAIHVGASRRARNEPRVHGLAAALRGSVSELPKELEAAKANLEDVVIEVPVGYSGAWLDAVTRPVSLTPTTALAMVLDSVPAAARQPAPEDLLALRRLVLTPLLSATTEPSSLPYIRASATALGFELLGPAHMSDAGDAVVLRPQAAAAAVALVARLDKRSGVVVEVPLGMHEALRGLVLRLAERLDADAVLVGLDPGQGALGNGAFAEAHAAAVWSAQDPSASIVVVRAAAIGAKSETLAEVATWGGTAGVALTERCNVALAQLGIETTHAALDLATREQAGRSVFGPTPLVAVTIDPRLLRSASFARAEPALATFADFPVVDEECSALAFELARDLPASATPAPPGLLEAARRAALERSVVARRTLQAALATTSSKAAIARASGGVFLVVVGRREHALVAGAFPLALTIGGESAAPPLESPTLAGCKSVLDRGGTCTALEAR